MWRLGRPELRVRNGDTESSGSYGCLIFTDCNTLAFFKHFHLDAPGRGGRVQEHSQLDEIPFRVGNDAQLFDSYWRDRLQPNRLPDSGGAVVINSFGHAGVRLLAARLRRILTILDANG